MAVLIVLIAGLITWPVVVDDKAAAATVGMLEEIPISIRKSGQDYLRAVRGHKIQSDITYLDERVTVTPPPPETGSKIAWLRDSSLLFWLMTAGFGAILLVTVSLGAKYGGLPTVSIESRPDDRSRFRKGRADGTVGQPRTAAVTSKRRFPDDFLHMEDRRAALVLLLNRALERTAEMNGMALMRSQTARGVLRALPQNWAHLPALQRLVREEELVHFGGRDLPESVFGECVEIVRPLFGRGVRT